VVGLQALSKYKIATYSPVIDLNIALLADNWGGTEVNIGEERGVVQFIVSHVSYILIIVIVHGRVFNVAYFKKLPPFYY
jgi:hypothetical protein